MKYAILVVAATVAVTACSSSSKPSGNADGGTGNAACPRDGVVLAAMRDVERDAEGVSYAVFGQAPDHAPDYNRANGVLGLLEQVWASSKSSCPDLPADAVAAVDDAIARLHTALDGKDQKAAAYAANDIHLQMAPLFDFFHPATQIEVVRMDATFLRVGIDSWFGDWSAFASNLTSLQTDWAALKSAASAKVPTCHRVAGTQSVVGDLDQSLTNLDNAKSSQDVTVAQMESDAGLLEVDILELLFDCPPDGTTPSSGLGAACTDNAGCDPGQVCDLDNSGGRCAPDPTSATVGAPCASTVDCGSNERNACNNEIGDGFPGGYCTMEPCNDVEVCAPGSTCVAMPFETPACFKSCSTDSDCRTSEGYVCQLFPTTPPGGFGPSDHACGFPCATDDECTSPLTCDVASGKCKP